MKASSIARRVAGVLLIAMAVLYICISVRLQQKDAKERSPIYQRQIVLKRRAENIANELIGLANRYDKGSDREKNDIEINEYAGYFERKVEVLVSDISDEGIYTNASLTQIYINNGRASTNKIREVAAFLRSLSDRLPTDEKQAAQNPENQQPTLPKKDVK